MLEKDPRYAVKLAPDLYILKSKNFAVQETTTKLLCSRKYKSWEVAKGLASYLRTNGYPEASIEQLGLSRTRKYLVEQNRKLRKKRESLGWVDMRITVPGDLKEELRAMVHAKIKEIGRDWKAEKDRLNNERAQLVKVRAEEQRKKLEKGEL